MQLFSSTPDSAVPLALLGGAQKTGAIASEKAPVLKEVASPTTPVLHEARQRVLVIATTTTSARAIQNALVPLEQTQVLRNSRESEVQRQVQLHPAPLLTFARSIDGADFCLDIEADAESDRPPYDAVLWEFPQNAPDALITAQHLANRAGSSPVIAVLFHTRSSSGQVEALSEAGMFAGLHSMIPVGELTTACLEEFQDSETPRSDSTDELCQAIRKYSHDVRNPLNCIQMLVDLMHDQLRSSEKISPDILNTIADSVERADGIVSELSQLAKARQKQQANVA